MSRKVSSRQLQNDPYIKVGSYQYKKSDKLGSGYESVVYRATHSLKKFEVALKIIDLSKIQAGITKDLLDSELKCLEILKGTPFVINLLEVVKTPEHISVVTDLCHGDLSQREKKKLPENEAWTYIKQMIKGYKALYKKKIVHRDLKPENLFVKNKSEILIGDFGFAAPLAQVKEQNIYSIGSPSYMAPEVLKRNEYSFASDIWSMGVSYYELITGVLPWDGETQEDLANQISRVSIKKIIEGLEVNEESKHFLRKTMCYDAYERIKPEELFSYELTKTVVVSEARNVSEKKQNDCISVTTAETPKRCNDRFEDFSSVRSKESKSEFDNLMGDIFMKSSNSEKNIKMREDRQSRKMSFDGNLLGSQKLKKEEFLTPVVKSENLLGEESFKKKHRVSFDCGHNKDIDKMVEKLSEKFIDNLINKHLKLTDLIFKFIQSSSLFAIHLKCKSHLNLFKVCLKNHLATTMKKILNIETSNLLIGLSFDEVRKYTESKYFKQTQSVLKSKIDLYQSNDEIRTHWSIAREQKLRGIKNAGFSLLSSLQESLNEDQSESFLQFFELACQILKVVNSMEKNNINFIEVGEMNLRKVVSLKNIMVELEEIEKLK